MHWYDTSKLLAAPDDDIELVSNYFNDKCNCYSYAVQDYLAGHLSNQNDDDFSYLPRPGQSRGKTYLDLMGKNIEGMRRAVHEDGINFAGMTYPKKFHQFKIQPVLDGLFSCLKFTVLYVRSKSKYLN